MAVSPRWRAVKAIALLWLVSGCRDSPTGSSSIPPLRAGQQTEAVIGPAGGSLVLSTEEGASVTLALPDGALDSNTTVRIETVATVGRQRFHLRFSPAGLVLAAGARATVRIQLPRSTSLPADLVLGYDGALVPFTRDANGVLDVQLAHFAEAPAGPSVQSPQRTSDAMPAASSGPACGGVPQLGDFAVGGLSDAELASAADYGRCVLGAVQQLAASGAFLDAVNLANATARYLQSIGTGDPGGFIAQADQITCATYRSVLDRAIATPVNSMGQLQALVRPILFWESAIQQRGGRCAQVADDEYRTVIANKMAEAAAFYATRGPAVSNVESPAYAEAVAEAREQQATVRQVQSLNPPAPFNATLIATVRDATEQVAQPALLATMLQAPWQRCRTTGQYDRLMELMQLMQRPPSVQRAARHCGVQLMARSLNASGSQEIARLTQSLGGVDATTERVTATLVVPSDGQIRLLGPIRALQCPAGTVSNQERIEVRINGALIGTFTGTTVADPELSFTMTALLAAAGIASTDFREATLTVDRVGNGCAGYWGTAPQRLATITLMAAAGPTVVRYEGAGTYRAACGFTQANRDWTSGLTVWLTTLADGTHRVVARSPWDEAVSGFQDFLAIADRTDPEIESAVFEITPIGVTSGNNTTAYSASWVGTGGAMPTHTMQLTAAPDGTATLTYTVSYTTACSDGGVPELTSYRFTFAGARVP